MNELQRNTLITDNIQYAKNVARQRYGRRHSVSYDEIEAAAYMGLVEAAGRYDAALSDNFRAYAYPRITGAICDFLRELQWGTRSTPVRTEVLADLCGKEGATGGVELFDKVTFGLTTANKTAMRLYYVEDKKIREIAQEMGVHESRVSQVLTESRSRLKQSWRGRESDLWGEVA